MKTLNRFITIMVAALSLVAAAICGVGSTATRYLAPTVTRALSGLAHGFAVLISLPDRLLLLGGMNAAYLRLGAVGDLAEIQDLIEKQGRAFEAFKAEHQKQLDEIKASGSASAETTAALEKANTEIQALRDKQQEIETKINRPANSGDPAQEQRDKLRAGFLNLMRGRPGKVDPEIQAALVEDATGELLVPEDVEAGIRRVRGQINVMRQLADIRTTTSNRVRRRNLTELAVGWGQLETGAALTETTPTPTEAYAYVEDLYGLIRIGEDELMDSDVNLVEYVNNSFGRAVADKEEAGFVVGTGSGSNQPEGWANGVVVTRVNASGPGAITADDLLNLQFAVSASYANAPGAAYIVLRATELAIRKLKDSNGQYLWQPSLQSGQPATFAGKPVYNQVNLDAIPAAGTAADAVAAFGDWKSGYQIIDRVGLTVRRLNELYATAGMVGFLAHARVTGYVSDAEALRILQVPAA